MRTARQRSVAPTAKRIPLLPRFLWPPTGPSKFSFVTDNPEAFDSFVGEWVAVDGKSIVAHGRDAASVATTARAGGIEVPFIFRVLPKLKRNEGSLGL